MSQRGMMNQRGMSQRGTMNQRGMSQRGVVYQRGGVQARYKHESVWHEGRS